MNLQPFQAEHVDAAAKLLAERHRRDRAASPSLLDDLPTYAEGFAELASKEDWTIWLAERGDAVLGYAAFATTDDAGVDDLLTPARCIELKIAATKPEARGEGLGTLLARYGLERAREEGYESCLIDWHVPSLLASRFWPKFGFEPVAYRLARRIDPRIAWADAGVGVGA